MDIYDILRQKYDPTKYDKVKSALDYNRAVYEYDLAIFWVVL